MRINKIDFDLLHKTLRGRGSSRTPEREFIHFSIECLFPTASEDLDECVTDGPEDLGVDAVLIFDHDDSAEVVLIQSKFHSSHTKANRNFPENESHKINSFVRSALDHCPDQFKIANSRLKERILAIRELCEVKPVGFRALFISNGLTLSQNGRDLLSALQKSADFSFQEVNGRDLIKIITDRPRTEKQYQLAVVGRNIFDKSDGDIRGAIANVDARSFMEMISEDDNRAVRRHIFDENIRVYLGPGGGYNKDIIRSAQNIDNYLFWYLNNGITIVCSNYSYTPHLPNPPLFIRDPQIVNGGQTSNALFEVYKNKPEALEGVTLLVKVFETERADIASRVAIATNSQQRISGRDLRANDEIQRKYEALFLEHGLLYERKKNQHSESGEKTLDALKFGQIILSYVLREPDKAKTNSDEIFGNYYNMIFKETWNFDDIISIIDLYSYIEDRRDKFIGLHSGFVEDGNPDRYLVYGQYFVLYCVSLICEREGKVAPEYDQLEPLVNEAIDIVAEICDQRRAVAQYNVFRSSRTREKISREFNNTQMDLFGYFERVRNSESSQNMQ